MGHTDCKSDSRPGTLWVAGVLAEFDGPEALKAAAAGVREAGYTVFEAYSPFPIHGLHAATQRVPGRRRTRLPWLVLGGGIAGGLGALLLQWWTNALDYPYRISGKPLFSLPANIPITFELIILLSALAAFAGGLVLGGLPELFHPLFACARFRRVTTDAFFLAIEASDPQFDETAAAVLLRSLGARQTEVYCRPETQRRLPGGLVAAAVILVPLRPAADPHGNDPRRPARQAEVSERVRQLAWRKAACGRRLRRRLHQPGTPVADRVASHSFEFPDTLKYLELTGPADAENPAAKP